MNYNRITTYYFDQDEQTDLYIEEPESYCSECALSEENICEDCVQDYEEYLHAEYIKEIQAIRW